MELPLNVGFLGSLRYFEYQKKIIEKLANDKRFIITYYGTGPEEDVYKEYKEKHNISNLFLRGEYDDSQKESILRGIDILNNSYGSKDYRGKMEVQYAISNKYYDGLQWRIPQLVEAGTYKCKKVEELGVGIGLNVEEPDFSDHLYHYYCSVDREQLEKRAYQELNQVYMDEQKFEKMIERFVGI